MNRRSFFGIFTLPLAVTPAKPADWGAGQSPHVVNNSARVLTQWGGGGGSTIITIGSGGYTWPGGRRD